MSRQRFMMRNPPMRTKSAVPLLILRQAQHVPCQTALPRKPSQEGAQPPGATDPRLEHASTHRRGSTVARSEGQGSRPVRASLGALPPAPRLKHRPVPLPSRPAPDSQRGPSQLGTRWLVPSPAGVRSLGRLRCNSASGDSPASAAGDGRSPPHLRENPVMANLTPAQEKYLTGRAVARWWPLMTYSVKLRHRAQKLAKVSMWITGRLISAEYRLTRVYTLSRICGRR